MTKYLLRPSASTPNDDAVGAVAGVLTSPRRRAIVSRLCRGPATTSDLAAETGVSLPTMQQHLERLRHAGLITSTKQGRTVTHTAEFAPLAELEDWIATRRSFWNAQLGALADALEGTP